MKQFRTGQVVVEAQCTKGKVDAGLICMCSKHREKILVDLRTKINHVVDGGPELIPEWNSC